LGNTVTSGDTNPDKANELLKKPDDNIKRCNSGVKTTTASCDDDKSVAYTGGTAFPSPPIGTKLYLNGYEIVLTSGDHTNGQGLLFFPYLMKRLPVEWNNIQIMKGEDPSYGCIVGASDKVQVQGSNAGALADDLNRQFTALAAWLNTPGSYTGTFGEAIEAMKTKAQELLDKISKLKPGEKLSPDDYKGYNSICKAIDKGLKAWKTQLDEQYGGANSDVPAIKQLYNDVAAVQADILKDVDCDGTGYRPTLHQETDLFHASLEPPKTPIHIPDLGGFLLTKCNLELGKANALKLSSLLTSASELAKNSRVEVLPASVSLKLVGQTLTCSYTYNSTINKYTYVFNEGVQVSSSNGELTVNGITYLPIKDSKTGTFDGFYQKNYQAAVGENPMAGTIKMIGQQIPQARYSNAYLANKNLYQQTYDLTPKNTLSGKKDTQLLTWLLSLPAGSAGHATFNSTQVTIYCTNTQTTNAQRIEVSKVVNNTPSGQISLWVDASNDTYKYQFFYGNDLNISEEEKQLLEQVFNIWALKANPAYDYSKLPSFFPFIAIFDGLTELTKKLKASESAWNCDSPNYQRPFHVHTDEDKLSYAFYAGIWDGVVGQVSGITDFVSTVLNEQKSILKEAWAAISSGALLDTYKQKYAESADKPCLLNYNIGHDAVDVLSLLIPVYQVASALEKTAIVSKLAAITTNITSKEALITLMKVAVKGANNTYRAVGGTVELTANAGKLLITLSDASVEWVLGTSKNVFGKSYALSSEAGVYVIKSGDGHILQATQLFEDAENILLKIKEDAQELLTVVKKVKSLDELWRLHPDLKVFFDGLPTMAKNNLIKLSPNTLKNTLSKLEGNGELLNVVNEKPALTRLWTAHKEPAFTAAEIAEAENIYLNLADELSEDARKLAEDLAEESGKKARMLEIFGGADVFEKNVASDAFKAKTGATQVVTQVTLEVDGVAIRVDYLGLDNRGVYHLGEAKFSTLDKNWNTDWLSAATDNQSIVLPKVKAGTVTEYVVKATDRQKLADLAEIGLVDSSGKLINIPFNNSTFNIFGSQANQQVVKTVVTLK